jgi:peptidoglycan/LPS O-acetylase OafA/YrhL
LNNIYRINNLDLIRLFAALEVAISHSISHLEVANINPFFLQFLHLFPGVPIFFFISGFLISKSYENTNSIKEYSRNRILRIYPGLILVAIIGISSVYLSGYYETISVSIKQIGIWFLGQTTIVQFYNPEFMRGYGVGVLNGSLWTISVELQFYILTPLLYAFFRFFNNNKNNIILYSLIISSMIIHFTYYSYKSEYSEIFIYKLLGVSFMPWFYMFLVGVMFQKNFSFIYKMLQGKLLLLTAMYLLIMYITEWATGNGINPILFLFLTTVIFSFSYTAPTISKKLLNGNDISYGVYIYHMVLVNLFIYNGLISNILYVVVIIVLAILIAIVSWLFIEKPFIKLKRKTIH